MRRFKVTQKNVDRIIKKLKKFYEMFPGQAKFDNWDGKTSDRMK